MTGEEAMAAYTLAAKLVKEGKYDEARAVKLLPSDVLVIAAMIRRAQDKGETNVR